MNQLTRLTPTMKNKASSTDLIDFLIKEIVALPDHNRELYNEMLEAALELRNRISRTNNVPRLTEIIPFPIRHPDGPA